MKASEFLRQNRAGLAPISAPSLVNLERAVHRVLERWPNGIRPNLNREQLARDMLDRLNRWDWSNVSIYRVIEGAAAIFDRDRREREEFSFLREFYLREIRQSENESFMSGCFWGYLDNFDPASSATKMMAETLAARRGKFSASVEHLLAALPLLLSPDRAVTELGGKMMGFDDPYGEMKQLGFPSPHSPGLLQHVHFEFVRRMAPHLDKENYQKRLLLWLNPVEGRSALQTGAREALQALLEPWRTRSPAELMRQHLTRAILAAYGDPRIKPGGIWAGFDHDLMGVLRRWLTGESMQTFCDVISKTQNSHQWVTRREYWLELFRRGRIDEAWVAFSDAAMRYAKDHYAGTEGDNYVHRFAEQCDRGGGTSLLIMKIGNKIVIDGCHDFRTYIFDFRDLNAPRLYQSKYYCKDIITLSKESKSPLSKQHNSIPLWKQWIQRNT